MVNLITGVIAYMFQPKNLALKSLGLERNRLYRSEVNEILKQYVKKMIDLRIVTDKYITFAQARINHRFKKYLGCN
ncbi:hypothetical protein [Candidatus Enterovibrio escicola]|uniref:hypothetical protein n=1 Tax=Candidatus Enterovibrio escicola TaxID=1927127 RepID=UPI000BE27669